MHTRLDYQARTILIGRSLGRRWSGIHRTELEGIKRRTSPSPGYRCACVKRVKATYAMEAALEDGLINCIVHHYSSVCCECLLPCTPAAEPLLSRSALRSVCILRLYRTRFCLLHETNSRWPLFCLASPQSGFQLGENA